MAEIIKLFMVDLWRLTRKCLEDHDTYELAVTAVKPSQAISHVKKMELVPNMSETLCVSINGLVWWVMVCSLLTGTDCPGNSRKRQAVWGSCPRVYHLTPLIVLSAVLTDTAENILCGCGCNTYLIDPWCRQRQSPKQWILTPSSWSWSPEKVLSHIVTMFNASWFELYRFIFWFLHGSWVL